MNPQNIAINSPAAWLMAIRPKTLIISIAVIALGQTLAFNHLNAQGGELDWTLSLVTLVCCLCLQIAVNLANDYYDGLSGIDNEHRLGPQRALQAGLVSTKALHSMVWVFISLSLISGSFLVWVGGWPLFVFGLLSIAGVIGYSKGTYSIASTGLGEITVFLFFGLLAVVGSYYLQTRELDISLLFAASQIGCLVAAIMLVNNIRDRASDEDCGKHTLAVRIGPGKSRTLYCLLLVIPYGLLIVDPYKSWLPLICLPLVLWLMIMIGQRIGKDLNSQLTETSVLVASWSFTYSLGLLYF